MTGKADRDQIRRQNRRIILQGLRRKGPLARIDLGKETSLSPATVTAITSDLLDQGMILSLESEEPKSPQARGRPRTLLKLNPEAVYTVGIRLSVNSIDLSLIDFEGQVANGHTARFDSNATHAESFPEILIEAIHALLNKAGVSDDFVWEIVVAAQGVVETETGTVAWSPAFAGRQIPIVVPLEKEFGAKCYISNDTNMITEALHWSDPKTYSGTFAVILLDSGVGMGLYLDGKLFAGANGTAAEFGHANHIPGGALCRCGKSGCLEAYLSDYALARAAANSDEGDLPVSVEEGASRLENLTKRAEHGDDKALEIFHKAGCDLGYGIARLIALIDPKTIVLTGTVVRAYDFMKKGVEEGLEQALVKDLRNNFDIKAMPWSEDFILAGLIAQSMERLDTYFPGKKASLSRQTETSPQHEVQAS